MNGRDECWSRGDRGTVEHGVQWNYSSSYEGNEDNLLIFGSDNTYRWLLNVLSSLLRHPSQVTFEALLNLLTFSLKFFSSCSISTVSS